MTIKGTIPVLYLKEGDTFIAFSPALDLSSCGSTFKKASENFDEALEIFFEECEKKGTLEETLISCGWVESNSKPRTLSAPSVIGHSQVKIPALG